MICVSGWQSCRTAAGNDEAIIVLVFHCPNDPRHWPSTAGEGWSSVTQNLPWLLLSQEWLSSFKVRKEILLALEKSKPGFGEQAVWKCACKMLQCRYAAPWGKETSLCLLDHIETIQGCEGTYYVTGKELQKEKQYVLFSKFKWDMVLLLNKQEYIMKYIALCQSW